MVEDAAAHPARIHWLIRLRWLALLGVSVGAGLAQAGLVPGVNVEVVALAVILGACTNLWLWWQSRRRDAEALHFGQALLDTGALSLVLWAAGGADCPFIGFYVFPVLLAALLAGRRALWPTGAASAFGLGFQLLVAHVPALQVGHWDPKAPWDQILTVISVLFTVAMAAYFAARLTDALRTQIRARQEADIMLRLAFDGLEAGLEVVERGRVVWQNPMAEALLGVRRGHGWRCPGSHGEPACPTAADLDRSDGDRTGPLRCQFTLAGPTGLEHIYELLAFPLPQPGRHMALYVDRTTEVLDQRRLVFTERLASLGRTVQGVAHELNTPLATIQTLGRDVLDVVRAGPLAAELRADLEESATMIVDEVQRCRRITHALLGRVETLDPRQHGAAPVPFALERAVAVVFTHDRRRVTVEGDAHTPAYPLDQLVQIFVNLLQNSRDADPGGAIEVHVEAGPERVRVTLRDHGPGLSGPSRAHLFEPFFTTKP
ncbi:MAG: histidine kinase dimerization/phospho-acceptor domain-containing protein, partial [bacterium]